MVTLVVLKGQGSLSSVIVLSVEKILFLHVSTGQSTLLKACCLEFRRTTGTHFPADLFILFSICL